VYKRRDVGRAEEYQLWGEFDAEPSAGQITDCLQGSTVPLQVRHLEPEKKAKAWWW